jgi:two-component system, NtrC family, sensor kinase
LEKFLSAQTMRLVKPKNRAFVCLGGTLYLLLVIALPSFSQRSKIDSLYKISEKVTEDTAKILIWCEIARHYRQFSLDTSMRYAQKSLLYSEKIHFDRGRTQAMLQIGYVYQLRIMYQKAQEYYFSALNLAQQLSDKKLIALALNNIGLIYFANGDFDRALGNFLKSLSLRQEVKDSVGICGSLHNIGEVYREQGDPDKAIEYYKQSIAANRKLGDIDIKRMNLNFLGEMYRKKGEYERALNFHFQALHIDHIVNDKWTVETLSRIGDVYRDQGNYEEALRYHLRTLQAVSDWYIGYYPPAIYYNNLGITYQKVKDWKKALEYSLQALQFAKQRGERNAAMAACEALSETYRQMGKFEQSLDYHIKLMAYRDTLHNDKSQRIIAEMQTRFDIESKINENQLLKLTNELQAHQMLIQDRLKWLIVLGFVIMSSVAWLFYRSSRRLKRLNQLLTERNKEISLKSTENERIANDLMSANNEIMAKNQELEARQKKIESQKMDLEYAFGELEKSHENIKETHIRMVQSEKMASLGTLTAGIAHELNNPANFVFAGSQALEDEMKNFFLLYSMYAELHRLPLNEWPRILQKIIGKREELQLDNLENDMMQIIKDVGVGADRIAQIVKGLRTFSRLDEDAIKPANLHESIDSTLIILRNQYKDRIKIIKKYDPQLPLVDCL